MGRRKIEIQPITHERNRSVTFLKRKNGLFKKAYELGVLCSVDVAVIIFEERPGHHVKLYQYCSTDVHSMVQRHLRFDGEKDTRGPADFNNTKVEEAVDDDEDIDDDEGNGQAKRRDSLKSGKVKVEGNGSGSIPIRPAGQQSHDSVELDYREARLSPIVPGASSSSIPISGERHNTSSSMRGTVSIANKRPRLAPNIGSPDVLGPHSAPAGFGNQSSPYSFRLDVDMSQYGTNVPPVTHAHSHPSLSALYNGPGSVSNVHSATSSQPAFFPQAPFDPPRPLNPPTLRSVAFSPQSSSSYPQQQQNQGGFPHQGRPQASQHGTSTNWFVELLNTPTEPAGTHHPPSDGHLSSFSWPVHVQQTQTQHENAPASQASADNNWFDFLPTSAQSGSVPGGLVLPLSVHAHTRPASTSISSTRSVGSFAVPPSSGSEGLSPAHKRSREDDGTGASGSDYNDEDDHSVFSGLMDNGRRERSGDGTDG